MDDLAFVDDGNITTQGLSFLQVVGGEDNRRAALIQFAQKVPHGTTHLDIHSCGGLI